MYRIYFLTISVIKELCCRFFFFFMCRWFRRLTTWCSVWSVPCAMWRSTSPAEALRWCTDTMRWAAAVHHFSLCPDGGDVSQTCCAPGSGNLSSAHFLSSLLSLIVFNFSCIWPHSGSDQQFGEPGVWAGHAEERRRQRWRSRRQQRSGRPLPRLEPQQSVAS